VNALGRGLVNPLNFIVFPFLELFGRYKVCGVEIGNVRQLPLVVNDLQKVRCDFFVIHNQAKTVEFKKHLSRGVGGPFITVAEGVETRYTVGQRSAFVRYLLKKSFPTRPGFGPVYDHF